MNRYTGVICVSLVVFVAAGGARATPIYPGYNCTQLIGYSDSIAQVPPYNSYGESLLPNGTVIGLTLQSTSPYLATWNLSSGTTTAMTTAKYAGSNSVPNAFGDSAGQIAEQTSSGISLYSGGTNGSFSAISQLNGAGLAGMSAGGLIVGEFSGGKAYAYDAGTTPATYYTFGTTYSWVQAVNGTYVVGGDGATGEGFVWNQNAPSSSYTLIPGLAAAQGVSDNGDYVAGINQPGASNYKAEVYTLSSGTYSLTGTYWNGEATGVNDGGLVIGDSSNYVYEAASGPWTGDAMAYFPGDNDPQGINLNHYAPTGVTFNVAQAVNDAGDILVWSNGWSSDPTDGSYDCETYLLTPVATPEPSALLLTATGLLGPLAYAWRKRKQTRR
jgi:hypothetical protein